MGTDVVQFGQHIIKAVLLGKGLYVQNDWVVIVLRSPKPPLAPVSIDVPCGLQGVADGDVVCPHSLLRIIGIVPVRPGVSLVISGHQRGAGGRTDRTAVGTLKIDAGIRQRIDVRSFDRCETGRTTGILPVRPNRTPPHVIDVEIDDVGTRSSKGNRSRKGCRKQTYGYANHDCPSLKLPVSEG